MRSDEELMVAYAGGDAAAFDALFRRYAPLLLRVLRRPMWRAEDAHDLVQQTFLQLHRHRADYNPERRFRPWLFTIAYNLQRDYFRRKSLRREDDLGERSADQLVSSDTSQQSLEARQSVEFALQGVTDDQREVIVMHWIGGLSLPEVAEIVGASLSAVKLRAHRGYAAMRARLAESEQEPRPQPRPRKTSSGVR